MKRRPIHWCHLDKRFRVSSVQIGKGFDDAFSSLWKDAGVAEISSRLQREMFWKKFRARIIDIQWYDTADGNAEREVIVDFEDEVAYVLFMLEWA